MSGLRGRRLLTVLAAGGLCVLPQVTSAGAPAQPDALQRAWTETVLASPSLRNASVSADAYDLTTNRPLAAIHPDRLQTPASVTKLFTSVAALAALGPNYYYRTEVVRPASQPALASSPLYLIGGGDAWLEANGTQGLEALAAQVAQRVRAASRVIGVSSLFTTPVAELGWAGDMLPEADAAGTSALMAERSEVEVWVTGAPAPGQPARVGLQFNGPLRDPAFFQIDNRTRTVPTRASGVTITRLPGANTIVVRGSIRPGAVSAAFVSVHDPALFAATLFQQALAARGVQFTAPAATGVAPSDTTVVAMHRSQSLTELMKTQNRFSINQLADNLFRTLGLRAAGTGSPAASEAAMSAFLASAGVPAGGGQVDGSGLSPLDQHSALQVVDLLRYAAGQPWFKVFHDSLMEMGNPKRCGVLCDHFFGTPAAGRVWLKTGNLANQWNYAGYAQARNGDVIAFAILIEGPPTKLNSTPSARLSAIDRMTVDLATWPSEPAAPAVRSMEPSAPPAFAAPLLRQFDTASGGPFGAAIVNLATGRTVWQENPGTLIRTGWVPRLGLLYAALASGRKAFAPVTVGAQGTIRGGTLEGSLVLDGSGDPAITRRDLAVLAGEVRRAGITAVTGSLEYVQGPVAAMGYDRWPRSAPYEEFGLSSLPPLSRLTVDGDVAELTVRASAPMQPATVTITPSDAPISVLSQAVGSPNGGSAQLSVQWQPGTDVYVVTGSVPAGTSSVVRVAPPDPGRLAAVLFRDALGAAGVQVMDAAVQAVGSASGRPVAAIGGSTLASIAAPLLRSPSSGAAAQVAELLGPAGTREIAQALSPIDVIRDPTGTSLGNYVTAQSVAELLTAAWHRPAERPLVQALGTAPWRVATPEGRADVGYVRGPQGTAYAVVLLQSGLGFSGVWAPQIVR